MVSVESQRRGEEGASAGGHTEQGPQEAGKLPLRWDLLCDGCNPAAACFAVQLNRNPTAHTPTNTHIHKTPGKKQTKTKPNSVSALPMR
jgi:hypothetical protein